MASRTLHLYAQRISGAKLVEYGGGMTRLFATNHFGTITARLNVSGRLMETYPYLPYGDTGRIARKAEPIPLLKSPNDPSHCKVGDPRQQRPYDRDQPQIVKESPRWKFIAPIRAGMKASRASAKFPDRQRPLKRQRARSSLWDPSIPEKRSRPIFQPRTGTDTRRPSISPTPSKRTKRVSSSW